MSKRQSHERNLHVVFKTTNLVSKKTNLVSKKNVVNFAQKCEEINTDEIILIEINILCFADHQMILSGQRTGKVWEPLL